MLAGHTEASKPTRDLILAKVAARLDAEHGHGTVPVPKPTRALALLREISKGTSAFGGTKAKRDIAGRPAAPYGRLRPARPGEYLLLDTTRLDVFAMDPVTLRWVQAELTVAMDLYDRCITGLRLTPVSTKAVDAAAALFEAISRGPRAVLARPTAVCPTMGCPVGRHRRRARRRRRGAAGPAMVAETIVVDHGRIYLSEHLTSVCARLGISIQPARLDQARTRARWNAGSAPSACRCSRRCPGTRARMSTAAAWTPSRRRSTSSTNSRRSSASGPRTTTGSRTQGWATRRCPAWISARRRCSTTASRGRVLGGPARADLAFEFLQAEWRTIQHYGVEIGGRRYDGRR